MEPLHPPTSSANSSHYEVNSPSMSNDAAKLQHQRLFQRGMRWLCGGVGLLGLSLVINFLLFQSDQSFTWLMYGMTSAGILCLIKSMADIFGF
ncbi:MAG: hypothetical protein ACK5SQ_06495 [Chitinophagales bacterium]|jgi:hypothetical protein